MMGSVDSPLKCFWNGHRSVLDAVVDKVVCSCVSGEKGLLKRTRGGRSTANHFCKSWN